VRSELASEGLPLIVEKRFELRFEFDMMGRSESRDGWRAMSAVGRETATI
jgi:hypothetical protein